MVESVKSYWTEVQRLIMESGLFDFMKEKLSGLVDWLDRAKWSGQMQDFAKGLSDWIVGKLKEVESYVKSIQVSFKEWEPALKDVASFLSGLLTLAKGIAWAFNVAGKALGTGGAMLYGLSEEAGTGPGDMHGGAEPYEHGGAEQETGWRPFIGGAGTTVNNYFNQNISRSDAVAIATETERQSYRDGE
jgi:phage tail tape-measure protein